MEDINSMRVAKMTEPTLTEKEVEEFPALLWTEFTDSIKGDPESRQELEAYLAMLAQANTGFWYELKVDPKTGDFQAVIWQTALGSRNLYLWGEVLFVDPQACTNNRRCPKDSLSVITYRKKLRYAAHCLYLVETPTTTTWALERLKVHNPGWTPRTIFCDMKIHKIQSSVFKDVRLCWCSWYAMTQRERKRERKRVPPSPFPPFPPLHIAFLPSHSPFRHVELSVKRVCQHLRSGPAICQHFVKRIKNAKTLDLATEGWEELQRRWPATSREGKATTQVQELWKHKEKWLKCLVNAKFTMGQ